jgi:hypothetical protein
MNLMDVYGLRDSSAAHSVADCKRRCPKRGIPIQKVFTPVYHTLRDTGTLPGFYAPLSMRLTKKPTKNKLYSFVSLDASQQCGR